MTTTTARLLPVKPGQARNAITNALLRHGMTPQTIEAVWHDLAQGNDPRPSNLPESFHYRGLRIDWPQGRHTRALAAYEIHSINAALKAMGVSGRQLLDDEDSAETARHAFGALFAHMTRPSVKYGPYDPEPVRTTRIRELVAEATLPICGDCTEPIDGEHDCLSLALDSYDCPFERDACLEMQDGGLGACHDDEHQPLTREQRLAALPTLPEQPVIDMQPTPEPIERPEPDALADLMARIDAIAAKLTH